MNELCNIRCVMLNYYDLGLLQVGLKSFVISVDRFCDITNYYDKGTIPFFYLLLCQVISFTKKMQFAFLEIK